MRTSVLNANRMPEIGLAHPCPDSAVWSVEVKPGWGDYAPQTGLSILTCPSPCAVQHSAPPPNAPDREGHTSQFSGNTGCFWLIANSLPCLSPSGTRFAAFVEAPTAPWLCPPAAFQTRSGGRSSSINLDAMNSFHSTVFRGKESDVPSPPRQPYARDHSVPKRGLARRTS